MMSLPSALTMSCTLLGVMPPDGMGMQVETIDYDRLDQPAVMRKGRASVAPSVAPSFDASEIPAFLRKQAD